MMNFLLMDLMCTGEWHDIISRFLHAIWFESNVMVSLLMIFYFHSMVYGTINGRKKFDMGCECGKRQIHKDVEKQCQEAARSEDLNQEQWFVFWTILDVDSPTLKPENF